MERKEAVGDGTRLQPRRECVSVSELLGGQLTVISLCKLEKIGGGVFELRMNHEPLRIAGAGMRADDIRPYGV